MLGSIDVWSFDSVNHKTIRYKEDLHGCALIWLFFVGAEQYAQTSTNPNHDEPSIKGPSWLILLFETAEFTTLPLVFEDNR